MKVSRFRAEVLVVGAGPSGSALAYHLARKGIDVLLVDRCRFPRPKVCGDALTPRSVYLLEQIGLSLGNGHQFKDFSQARLFSPDGKSVALKFRKHGPVSSGRIVPRIVLDHMLVSLASSAGAEFLEETNVIAPLYRNGSLGGAIARRKDDRPLDLIAKVVVAADGSAGTLSRRLGLASSNSGCTAALGARTYFDGVKAAGGEILVFYCADLLPCYGWIFPMTDGRANVGVAVTKQKLRSSDLREHFRYFVEAYDAARPWLASSRQISPLESFPLKTSIYYDRAYSDGALAVGDAAGLIDPLTGQGLSYALESAQLAADCIRLALQEGDLSRRALRSYGNALRSRYWFKRSVSTLLVHLLRHGAIPTTIVTLLIMMRTMAPSTKEQFQESAGT